LLSQHQHKAQCLIITTRASNLMDRMEGMGFEPRMAGHGNKGDPLLIESYYLYRYQHYSKLPTVWP
jgi:hypothetical protein